MLEKYTSAPTTIIYDLCRENILSTKNSHVIQALVEQFERNSFQVEEENIGTIKGGVQGGYRGVGYSGGYQGNTN